MSAARKEDFHNIQVEVLIDKESDHAILKHVNSRWLTLAPACDRIIEQYPALKEYFLEFLPKNDNVSKLGERYLRIVTFLKDPNTLVYLHFVSFFASCFLPYLKLFQKQTPLIHILYSKLNELLRNIMFKFMKQDAISKKEGLSLKNVDCYDAKLWVARKNINIGSGALNLIDGDFDKPDKRKILLSVRSCFIETTAFLQKKLPIANVILKDIRCIDPALRGKESSKAAVNRLVHHLLKISKTNYICDAINTEWCMYACEKFNNTYADDKDICKYWSEVSKIKDAAGAEKYPHLCAFLQSCLTLSHGNAIPERGFSINNTIVVPSKPSVSELGIRSLRMCKDFFYRFNKVNDIPITKELVQSVEKSHSAYAAYLENLKEESKLQLQTKRKLEEAKEENAKKQKKLERITELTKIENNLIEEENAAHRLLGDANEKLKLAISKNDMNGIKVSQMMINAANDNINSVSKELTNVRHNISKIRN